MLYGVDCTHWDLMIEAGLPNQGYVLRKVGELGLSIVRAGLWHDRWVNANFFYAGCDGYVEECRRRGVPVLFNLLCYMDIFSLGQWLDFVLSVAERYKGQIAAYQVFNEEDDPTSGSIWPTPMRFDVNPNLYAEFLSASYYAIKSVDPKAEVVMGGTTTIDDGSYVETVIDGYGAKCDAVATHFYGAVGDGYARLPGKISRLKELDLPIWITEFGTDAPNQSEWMLIMFQLLEALDVDAAVYFTFPYLMSNWPYGVVAEPYYTLMDIVKAPRPADPLLPVSFAALGVSLALVR